MQLTKLLVSGADDTNAAVSKLHGYHGHLASYLTEQVISKMPSELREFVLKTSILERFNSDLANAVTDRENGLECIRALEPLQALLVPLDDDWEWYRYHHLFAECLQDLLRQEGQDAFVKLHKKAASKFCELGLFADAVRHAREARDFDQCASIIIEAGGWELILFGGIGYLAGLMANIPEKEMRKYPRLLYARSYLAMKHGDIPLARAFYDAAILREKELEDVSDGVRDKLSVGMLLDIYEETPITKPEANVLERYLEQIGETDAVSRGINYCLMSLRDLAFGDFTSGYECAQKAMKAMREGDTVLGLNYCFVHAGMNALHNGKYQVATANFDKAGELAADNFGADSGLRYFTDLCTYALLYWKSDLDEKAAKNLKRAVSYVQDYDGWSEYYMLGFDALFHRAIQKNAFDEALEVLRELRRTAAERNLDRLAKFADALELRMLVTQNKLTKASMIFENIITWFDVGALGKSNTTWQPGITAACSCACFLAAIGKFEQAIEYIDKGLAVTEKIGAEFYRLRILLVKATIMKQADRMEEAVEALLRALDLGAQNGLRQPFIVNDIEKLLRVTRSQLRFDEKRLVTADFLSKILERDDNSQQQVSNRETEVLEELSTGKSNKEIARALDMTENTVKFHLKNIFSKLNVSRRVQAIEKARQLDLID